MTPCKLCLFILFLMLAVIFAKPADSDPPPLDCPENEIYFKCALERCFKTCNHLINYPACPMLSPGCVDQACVCKNGYLRNVQGVCVPEELCPEWSQVLENNGERWWTSIP